MSFTLELSSSLAASADEVWAHASTMEGVNSELAPFVKMTVPASMRGRSLSDLTLVTKPGDEAFVSTLLAFGWLPFDRHHLRLRDIGDRSFAEESWSWLQRRWCHERTVTPDGDGCVVTDRLVVEPRGAPRWLVEPMVRAIFEARHRVLARRFGAR